MLPTIVANSRRWDGHKITRQFYAATGRGTAAIPGAATLPGAGQMLVSPDLRELIKHNAVIAGLFNGIRDIGTVRPDGLVQPHELRAVIGIPPGTPLLENVTGFGRAAPTGTYEARQQYRRLNRVVAGFVGVMVWLPAAAFIIIVARLAATQRRKRARALRMVGLSRRAVRVLQAVEMGLAAAPGVVAAAVIYLLVQKNLTSVPGTDLGFFTTDTHLPPWLVVLVCLAPVSALCLATSLTLDPESTVDVLAAHPRSWPSRVGQLSVGTGTALLAGAPLVFSAVGFLAAVGLWVGCALVALGLALAGPEIATKVMQWVAGRAKSGGRLVGARFASTTASTSLRLGSLLAIVILMLLGGGAFTDVLNGGSATKWQTRVQAAEKVPVIANDLTGNLSLEKVRARAPGTPVVQQMTLRSGRNGLPIVVASCADLANLTGAAPANCSGEPQWIGAAPRGLQTGTTVSLPGGRRLVLPTASPAATVSNAPATFDRALLLPERLAPATAGNGSLFFLLPTSDTLMPALAKLSAASPTVQLDLGDLDRHNPDTQEFPAQAQWLFIGAISSLVVGVLALIATGIGEARERSSRLRALRLIGAPRRELLYAHWWATAAPLIVLGTAASILGWLTVVAMHNFDDRATVSSEGVAVAVLGVVVAASVVAMSTWATTERMDS